VAAPAPKPVKPGIFAPKAEKQLYKALTNMDVTGFVEVGNRSVEYRAVAYGFAGIQLVNMGSHDDARSLLSIVMDDDVDPGTHPFTLKYVSAATVTVSVAPGVQAVVPFDRDAVGLTLAELHQETGDLESAISVVESLEPTAHAAVSLAELYIQTGRHEEVIDLTNGIKNEDDATALLCVYRGVALREQGFYEASREAFKEALKSKSRAPEIRHLGLSERAYTYLAENKKATVRKDLERILAENASYAGIRERLEELP